MALIVYTNLIWVKLVGSRHAVEGTLMVAVAVEAADQLAAVGVAERDCHVLGGHVYIIRGPIASVTRSQASAP
jgi:hypothetical protein